LAANQLPSADEVANSMYGGSQDLFKQAPLSPPSPMEQIPEIPQVPAALPVPESGLPEGWTMEQWQYYGKEWLESQKEG